MSDSPVMGLTLTVLSMLQVAMALQSIVQKHLDDSRDLTRLLGVVQHMTQRAAMPAATSDISALYSVEALDLSIDDA